MKRLLLIVVLLSAVTGMRNFANADSTAGQEKDLAGKEMTKDCPHERMDIYLQLEDLMKQLNLINDQKKAITDIMNTDKAKVEQLHNNMIDNRNDLMQVSFSAQYNKAQSDSIIDKLSILFKEEQTCHVQMMREIYAQLTALQQEQIQKLIPKNQPKSQPNSSHFMNWNWMNWNW
jgi:Spy/CpxP family protein refolding chaperone